MEISDRETHLEVFPDWNQPAEEIKGFIRRGLNGDNSGQVSALNRVWDEFESTQMTLNPSPTLKSAS